MKKNQDRHSKKALHILSLLALFAVLLILSVLSLPYAIGVVVSVAVIIAYNFGAYYFMPYIIAMFGCSFFQGIESLSFAAFSCLIGIACSVMFRKKVPYRIIFVIATVLVAAQYAVHFGILAQAQDTDILSYLYERFAAKINISNSAKLFLFDCIPAVFTVVSMIFAGLIVYFGYKFSLATGRVHAKLVIPAGRISDDDSQCRIATAVPLATDVDMKSNKVIKLMFPLELWTLSSRYSIGAIVIVLCVIAVNIFGLENARVITVLALCVIGFPLYVQGYAFLMYSIARAKYNAVLLRLFMLSLIVITSGVSVIALIFLGICDQIIQERARIGIWHIQDDKATDNGNNNDNKDENKNNDGKE